MKKKLLAGLAVGLFFFCMVGLANATLITQEFYIEIDSINIGSLYPGVSNISFYQCPDVGSKFYGTVTYNNANIPVSGSYIIGENVYYPYVWYGDELQHLKFHWVDTNSYVNASLVSYEYAYLTFMDSKISAIDAWWVPDMSTGINQASIQGNSFGSRGTMVYFGSMDDGGPLMAFYTSYGMGGTVHFPVPEPTTMLLLGLGLMGLAGVKKKVKK